MLDILVEYPSSPKTHIFTSSSSVHALSFHLFFQELSGYTPPPGYDQKGDALESHQVEVKGRKGKTLRDANAPKRNLSAYLLYQNAMRDKFKGENRKFEICYGYADCCLLIQEQVVIRCFMCFDFFMFLHDD